MHDAEPSLALLASLRCSLAGRGVRFEWGMPLIPHSPRSGLFADDVRDVVGVFRWVLCTMRNPRLRSSLILVPAALGGAEPRLRSSLRCGARSREGAGGSSGGCLSSPPPPEA